MRFIGVGLLDGLGMNQSFAEPRFGSMLSASPSSNSSESDFVTVERDGFLPCFSAIASRI